MRIREHWEYWRYSLLLFWDQAWGWFFHSFFDFGSNYEGTMDLSAPKFKVQIYEDKKGEYRWRLVASNGRIICVASEGYKTKRGVVNALNLTRKKIIDAEVE